MDTKYIDRSPNFQTDLGFIQRVNIRQIDESTGYYFRPSASRIVAFGSSVTGGATWDHSGRLTDWYGGGQFAMYFKGPVGFEVSEFKYYTLYLNQALQTSRTDSTFYVTRWKRLNLSGTLGHGTNVNYNPAQGLNPFVAGATDASFSLTWRPTSRFRMDNTYYFSHLGGMKGDAPAGFDRGSTVFNNHLFRSKMNYQFSRALSVRTIVDYNGILPNSSLIWQDKYKRITGDFLLTYQLNPGTSLYIGYTNRYENLALAYNGRYAVIPTTGLANSTARQVFVKLNYLFRF
jgi:hypothetical protein